MSSLGVFRFLFEEMVGRVAIIQIGSHALTPYSSRDIIAALATA